jgi:hypothetical protein
MGSPMLSMFECMVHPSFTLVPQMFATDLQDVYGFRIKTAFTCILKPELNQPFPVFQKL